MKLRTFNLAAGTWGDPQDIDIMGIRLETERGVFDITERDGILGVRAPDGTIRIAPRTANDIEIKAHRSYTGRSFE